jgi:hypothetical protein
MRWMYNCLSLNENTLEFKRNFLLRYSVGDGRRKSQRVCVRK